MRQQSIAIVLSALLLGSYGYDLAARNHPQEKEKKAHDKSHLQTRDASTACSITCSGSESTGNLTIAINTTTSLVGVFNTTTQSGLIIDIKANLTGILYLRNNSLLIINLQTNETRFVENVWSQSGRISVEIFFESLTTLTTYYQQGSQVQSSSLTLIFIQILSELNQGQYDISTQNAFIVFEAVVIQLYRSFQITLQFFSTEICTEQINLTQLMYSLYSFRYIVVRIGIQRLQEVKFQITLTSVVQLEGAALLQRVASSVSSTDLTQTFGSLTQIEILTFFYEIYGESASGVGGVFTLIADFVMLRESNSTTSVEQFLEVIFSFAATRTSHLQSQWNAQLRILSEFSSSYNLTNFEAVVTGLRSRNLQVGSVQLNRAIKFILRIGSGGDSVREIVELLIESGEQENYALAVLFREVIFELRSRAGLQRVSIIFHVKFDASIAQANDPLSVIFSGSSNLTVQSLTQTTSIMQIIKKINNTAAKYNTDLDTALLSNLQIFAEIVRTIQISLQASGSGSESETASGTSSGNQTVSGGGSSSGSGGGSASGGSNSSWVVTENIVTEIYTQIFTQQIDENRKKGGKLHNRKNDKKTV